MHVHMSKCKNQFKRKILQTYLSGCPCEANAGKEALISLLPSKSLQTSQSANPPVHPLFTSLSESVVCRPWSSCLQTLGWQVCSTTSRPLKSLMDGLPLCTVAVVSEKLTPRQALLHTFVQAHVRARGQQWCVS